jgi:RNA recognition motif-containing protein
MHEMGINIYVGNLSYNSTEDALRDLFGAYGTVERAKIITDQFTGRSKGFGFIEMADRDEGMNAIRELDAKELDGRTIKVNEAKPRQSSGGGGGGGRDNNRRSRW